MNWGQRKNKHPRASKNWTNTGFFRKRNFQCEKKMRLLCVCPLTFIIFFVCQKKEERAYFFPFVRKKKKMAAVTILSGRLVRFYILVLSGLLLLYFVIIFAYFVIFIKKRNRSKKCNKYSINTLAKICVIRAFHTEGSFQICINFKAYF